MDELIVGSTPRFSWRLDCHWLLLRLAGRAPDELLTQCRRWLAEGRAAEVGRATRQASLSLTDVLATEPLPTYGFAPTRAGVDARMGPAADTVPGKPMPDACPEDDIDRAALSVASALRPVRAIWRVWRFPGDGATWPPPRRVFVIETDQYADPTVIPYHVQEHLAQAGESHPQVEVYRVHEALPSYQRLARAFGALLWSREPDPGVRVAAILDGHGGEAPYLTDRPRMGVREAAPLVRYLIEGEPLLLTASLADDAVDPGRGKAVPMNMLTDGRWVWSEASAYYLERYGLAPEQALLDHIRGLKYRRPELDGATLYRALAVVREAPSDEPVWLYGT